MKCSWCEREIPKICGVYNWKGGKVCIDCNTELIKIDDYLTKKKTGEFKAYLGKLSKENKIKFKKT